MKNENPFQNKINITSLALAITKKNVQKGNYKPRVVYASNKKPIQKVSKNKYVKNPNGNFFFIKGNMHEQGFKGLINRSKENISKFLDDSENKLETLNL